MPEDEIKTNTSPEPTKVEDLSGVTLKRRQIPKKISLKDVPKEIKEAMGIEDSIKNINQFIEADPAVQAELAKIQPTPDEVLDGTLVKETAGVPGMGGAPLGVPRELIEKRNNRIIDWHCMGLTSRTILHNINALHDKFGRGKIETERHIKRIVAEYFGRLRPSNEDINIYDDAMREASYSAQEKAIEKLSMVALNKPQSQWKSDFEYAIVLEKIVQAHQLAIENRGWNKSRANPLLAIQNNNQINVINQNVDQYATKGIKDEKVKGLLDKLESILGD